MSLPCLVHWPEDRQKEPRLDQLALLDLPVLLNTPIYLPSATSQAAVSDPAAELVGTIPMIHTYSTDPVNTVTENTFHCLSMKINTHKSQEMHEMCAMESTGKVMYVSTSLYHKITPKILTLLMNFHVSKII